VRKSGWQESSSVLGLDWWWEASGCGGDKASKADDHGDALHCGGLEVGLLYNDSSEGEWRLSKAGSE